MRVVKFQRISTNHQELENQTKSLDNQIERMGWDCVGEYKEIESGMKSRDSRPQLRKLLQDSKKRMFDFVMVYSLDRLGRSTVDVINTIHELEEVSVHIFVVKETKTQGWFMCYLFTKPRTNCLTSKSKEVWVMALIPTLMRKRQHRRHSTNKLSLLVNDCLVKPFRSRCDHAHSFR